MATTNPKPKSNVIDLSSARCKAEGCNKKHTRAEFCAEHFEWFKAGLINKDGQQVPDFDKKMQAYKRAA